MQTMKVVDVWEQFDETKGLHLTIDARDTGVQIIVSGSTKAFGSVHFCSQNF